MDFTKFDDGQLGELRSAAERELQARARTAEQRRPVPNLEDIRPGMKPEEVAAVRSEINRLLRDQ